MKTTSHPEREFFEFIAGRLDSEAAQAIEDHLATCAECKVLHESLLALKSHASTRASHVAGGHPTIADLADFFYSNRGARNASVAAHLAVCSTCAEEISQYARAEAAASSKKAARPAAAQVPTTAWEMIRDWEDSVFAKPKDDMAGSDLLEKLSAIHDSLDDLARSRRRQTESLGPIEVTVIDSTCQVRTIELFEHTADGFKHAAQSRRYDERPVHALLDFGEGRRLVVSDRVRGDRIELTRELPPRARPLSAAYFIVED